MKLPSGVSLHPRLLVAIWILWFLSAATLLVSQSLELFGYGDAPQRGSHPEIPASDPTPVLAVISACKERVESGTTLGVAYQDGDPQQLFIAYRLAYELYPRRVASKPYSEGGLQDACRRLEEERHPTQILVFAGPGFVPPAELDILARLPLNSYLIQPAAPRNP
jgi:hypothetical protein